MLVPGASVHVAFYPILTDSTQLVMKRMTTETSERQFSSDVHGKKNQKNAQQLALTSATVSKDN